MKNSYGELDDKEPCGCRRPVVVLAVIILLLAAAWQLCGCKTCPCPPDVAEVFTVLSTP